MGIEIGLTGLVASLLEASGAGIFGAAILAPYVTTALALGAVVGLNYFLSPKPPGAGDIDPGRAKDTINTSEAPELRAIGRVRLGGVVAFGNSTGFQRYRMYLHCKGKIDAIEEFYIGGREVVVNQYDFSVSSPPWSVGGNFLFIHWNLGDPDKDAWDQLHSNFPTLWSVDHRARGIAQSLLTYISPGITSEKFAQLYQGGLQELQVVARGEYEDVYDPRTGTNGWTSNGVINALHILRSYPELNDLDLYDLPFLAGQADAADELIGRRDGGSTPRARAWGVWTSENNRGDTMQQVLDSIGAMIVPRAGGSKLGIQLIDDIPIPEVTIYVKNIIEFEWHAGPQSVERPNVCSVWYYSPERNFEMTEIDVSQHDWSHIDSEIEANGKKPYELKLPFCPDSGQAQQIARRKFAQARADTGVVRTNMTGLAVLGCRIVSIEFPDDLGFRTCLIGPPRVLDDRGQVEITFAVWPDLTEWDGSIYEAAAPDEVPEIPFGTPLGTPFTVGFPAHLASGGTGWLSTLPSDAIVSSVEATFRVYATDDRPYLWQPASADLAGSKWIGSVGAELVGVEIDYRVRWFDNSHNGSDWSNVGTSIVQASTLPEGPSLTYSTTTHLISAVVPDNLWVSTMRLDTGTNDAVTPNQVVTYSASAGSGAHTVTLTALDGATVAATITV